MKEVWKKSPSWACLEISSIGRVRRCEDQVNHRWKRGKGSHNKGYVYIPRIRDGYSTIRLNINGKRKHLLVNRLVCEAFNGPSPNGNYHAAHKNGDQTKNFPKNLYWATPQQNIEDRERHGKTMRGDGHYYRKLSSCDIPKIRKFISAGIPSTEIAKKYGVTSSAIKAIKGKITWKHV